MQPAPWDARPGRLAKGNRSIAFLGGKSSAAGLQKATGLARLTFTLSIDLARNLVPYEAGASGCIVAESVTLTNQKIADPTKKKQLIT